MPATATLERFIARVSAGRRERIAEEKFFYDPAQIAPTKPA